MGIYEVMKVTDRIRRMIAQRASEDAIREVAQSTGMLALGDDALAKVKAGLTTAEELLRVVTEVREVSSVCPGCMGPVALDFVACPSCGRRLSGDCPAARAACSQVGPSVPIARAPPKRAASDDCASGK